MILLYLTRPIIWLKKGPRMLAQEEVGGGGEESESAFTYPIQT